MVTEITERGGVVGEDTYFFLRVTPFYSVISVTVLTQIDREEGLVVRG